MATKPKTLNALSAAEAIEPNLDRRSFARCLGIAALAVGATAGVVQAGAALNPDEELIRLGAEFEAAWAAERATKHPFYEEVFEAAYGRSASIAHRIMVIPAKTLDGLRVKARAVLWCRSGEPIADASFSYDEDHPTTDLILAAGIVRDLLAIGGQHT